MQDFRLTYGLDVIDEDGQIVKSASESDIKGWITSCLLIGSIVGSMMVSVSADVLGRKKSLLCGGFIFTIGAVVQSVVTQLPLYYVGRIISGVGIGSLSMCAPLYVSETSPSEIRGRMVSAVQLLTTIGILLASCVNALLIKYTTGQLQWKLAIGMLCVPGVLLITFMFFNPQSPRWLVNKDRDAEAIYVIAKLRSMQPNNSSVVSEYTDIKQSVINEREVGQASWRELLKPGIINRVLIMMTLQAFQQWTGINVILFYAGSLFADMGLVGDNQTSSTLVIINSLINFLAVFPGMYLVERMGRKKLLIIGGLGMGTSHFLVFLFTKLSEGNKQLAWGAICSVCKCTLIQSNSL